MDIVEIFGPDGKPVHFYSDDEAYDQVHLGKYSYSAINHNRQPAKKEISLCRTHIDELITSFAPKAVIHVGAVARDHYRVSLPSLCIRHPASISRQEYKLLDIKKEARKLQRFIEGLS
jgi:uracil-DNA glycosylase